MAESIQHKLLRVRPPRVAITYDVETGGAIEMKELPFVVAILADLSGKIDPENPPPPLKERKFIEIDRDNFNDVMDSYAGRLAFPVADKLQKGEDGEDSGNKLNVSLDFNKIDDFRPENLVHQIEPLAKLYEARTRLNDLIAKLDGNDNLDALLQDVAQNTESLRTLQKETEAAAEDGAADGEAGKKAEPAAKAAEDKKPEGKK